MKKTTISILILLLLLGTVQAQGPGPIYLPIILSQYVPECVEGDVSNWYIIIPQATVNYVLNPSAETTGNFAAAGGGAMARSSTYSRYGLWSFRITTAANNDGGDLTLSALANAIHYVTMRVRGTLPTYWDWSLDGGTYNAPTLLEQLDSNWALYGCQFPAAEANGSTTLEIRQDGGGAGDFYVDGVQVEQLSYWTTYADGDQQGCEWNGAEHASTSTRSASSRAGGRQRDLEDIYFFDVGGQLGAGTAPQSVIMDEYAILPGGELNTVKVHPRPLTLTGVVRGTDYADMHQKLNDLESVLLPDAYPPDENGWQPVRLRYTGSTIHKEIAAHYETGMEGSVQATDVCYWQRMAIRFIAPDPYFYDYGGSGTGGAGEAMLLDTNDSATLRYVAGRLKSTGQWDDLGLGANPTVPGARPVHATAVHPDGSVYVGGTFTGWNGNAGWDHFVRYIPSTDTWERVGAASEVNGDVWAIAIAPNGDVALGGNFTNLGGGAGDYVSTWNGAAYVPVGGGGTGQVYALAYAPNGDLYIGGSHLNWNGLGVNFLVMWDLSAGAYATVGGGTAAAGDVQDIVVRNDGHLYIGGAFTNWAGIAEADAVAQYDGAWSALDEGIGFTVWSLALSASNELYAGFAGDPWIQRWNGTAWTGVGTLDQTIYDMEFGPDGLLWATGPFTEADGHATDGIGIWNGSTWTHMDVNPSGANGAYSLAIGQGDPVISEVYDVWLGLATTGAGYFAGTATATNGGTAPIYPVIVFERSGGTSATIISVRNETTGKWLLFDYALLDGERLTIDLRPTQQSIVSSMFGPCPDAILANSDMGSFTLQPGVNQVTSFVDVAGAPTITAWVEWRTRYRGL